MLKLASWNVNSLKVRLEHVTHWLQENQVDILALQETKLINEQFPEEVFTNLGYQFVYSGQKTYNGVAIISRQAPEEVLTDIPMLDDPQRRILAATIGDIRLVNLYVPNGSAVGSEKYEYKLTWLKAVTSFLEAQLQQYDKVAVVGDFNIAPEDIDVHDPSEWEGDVLVSPPEREALQLMMQLGLEDAFRCLNPKLTAYSWWDYRAASFRRNRGLRIDHILLSHSLYQQCKECHIDVEPRRLERPSDHAPVWACLEI